MTDAPLRGAARERDLPRETYLTDAYFRPAQLWSFAEQIHHLHAARPSHLLEIGPGNGFVSEFLRRAGLRVSTCDINPALDPDLVCGIGELDTRVQPGTHDLIACCEVLEHLPFEEFPGHIETLARLAPNLFLSLPVAGRTVGFGGMWMKSWGQRWCSAWWHLPSKRYPLPSMHFWEVGWRREHRPAALLRILRTHYAEVDSRCFRLNPYHRYFHCRGSRHCPAGEVG